MPTTGSFVGRSRQLRAAIEALTALPAVVLVQGASGMGKSRFLQQLLTQQEGGTTLTVRCPPLRPAAPFCIVKQLSEAVVRAMPASTQAPAWEATVYGWWQHVRQQLSRLAPPVIVAVEDLHWADPSSRDVLRCLATQPPPATGLVLSYRAHDVPRPGLMLSTPWRPGPEVSWTAFALPPFTATETAELVGELLGVTVSGTQAARLVELTGGIPALIEELIDTLRTRDDGGAGLDEALAAPPVPTGIAEQMAYLLHLLPSRAQDLVHAAAVLAEPASQAQLGELAALPADRVAEALQQVTSSPAILVEIAPDRYRLPHELARLAVYGMLAGPQRQSLHQLAARMLRLGLTPPAVLARHYRLAGEPALACTYAENAAEEAMQRADTPAAVSMLQLALAEPTTVGPERARLAGKLGRIAVQNMSYQDTIMLLRRILGDDTLPIGLRGELRLHLGLLLMNQAGDGDAGRAETIAAVHDLRHHHPALAARGMAALALAYWGSGSIDEHLAWMQQAEQVRLHAADPALVTAVHANRASLLMEIGDPAAWSAADELGQHMGTLAQRQQVARAYGNLADAAVWLGHYGAAENYLQHARTIAAEGGATYMAMSAEATALRLDLATGKWSGLADRADRLLGHAASTPLAAADARLVRAELALIDGGWEEALTHADTPGLRTPADGCAPWLTAGAVVRAQAHLARDNVTGARTELRAALALTRAKGVWVWSADLAIAAISLLARCGHLDEAKRILADLSDGVTGRDAPHAAAAMTWCRASLAEAAHHTAEAAEWYALAAEQMSRLPRPYAAAKAAEAEARCRLACGQAATDALLAAAQRFETLGAGIDTARCHHLLRRCGWMPPQRRGRRGYGTQLSPREREVARLISQGRTNREIADVLFLSHRTVEQHAAKILRKLGARTRSEVTAPQDPCHL